jgi:hypothetical protein
MACLTNYTVQCVDVTTGKTGCFLFDEDHWQKTGKFKATSKIYPDLYSFYKNTDPALRKSAYLERNR